MSFIPVRPFFDYPQQTHTQAGTKKMKWKTFLVIVKNTEWVEGEEGVRQGDDVFFFFQFHKLPISISFYIKIKGCVSNRC